jgi:hypothetical protein
MSNVQLAEALAALAFKAGTANSTPLETPYVAVTKVDLLLATAILGNMAAETIDIAIYQATDTSGTSAKIAKAATQLAANASNNDDKAVVIGIRKDELDIAGGFVYVAVRCTTGAGTGGVVGLLLQGGDLRYGPGSGIDSASVLEVKI